MPLRPAVLTCWLSVLTLSACGGGGGGGGSGGGTQPPPPPPPPSGVVVTTANAADVVTVGAGLIEAGVQLTLAGVNPIVEVLNDGGLSVSRGCGGGTLNVTVVDNDMNGELSAGDTVDVDYVGACFSGPLNDEATGSMRFDVTRFRKETGNSFLLDGTLSLPGSFVVGQLDTVSVSATLDVSVIVRRGAFEVLAIAIPPAGEFRADIRAGGTSTIERATTLSVRRFVEPSLQGDRAYTVSASAGIDSGLLGGDIDCSTVPELSGPDINDDPVAGRLTCTGSGNSAARIDSERANPGLPIAVQADPEGDGSFVNVTLPTGPAQWGNLIERALFAERIATVSLPPPAGNPLLVPESLALAVNQLVDAPVTNRVIATTDTGVVEIDPATMTVTRSIPLAGSPGALALSDDESLLWVALDDRSEIQRIDYPSLIAGPSFPLGDSYLPGFGPRDVFQVEVAPGTTDLVVLSTPNAVEILAYDNGVLLPETIDDFDTALPSPRAFVFRDPTTIVAVDDTSTGAAAFRLILDPANGLSIDQEFPGLSGRLVGKLKLGNGNAFATGRVFNEATGSVEALLEPAFEQPTFYSDVQVDTSTRRVLAIGGGVDVFDEDTFAQVGRYDTSGVSSKTLLTGDYLFIARTGSVDRYLLADLQPNLPADPCVRTDVGGLWIDGTYVQQDCGFTEAVFDAGRNRLYAGLPNFSERGNSIAVIDPATLEITTWVPLNGTPKSLNLSADGAALYAILDETSKVIEVDLETLVPTDVTILGFRLTQPVLGDDLALTTRAGAEFVVADNEVGLYGDGNLIGSRSPFTGATPDQVFTSTDGGTAITRDFDNIAVFSVDAGGVTPLSTLPGEAFPRRAEQRGDFFYEGPGTRFDFVSQSVETVCTLPPFAPEVDIRVGPDRGSDLLFYGAIGDRNSFLGRQTIDLVACDPVSGTVGAEVSVFAFKVLQGQVTQVLPVSGGRVVVLTDTHMVLLDRPSL